MRILFADDDPDTRKLAIRAVLQELQGATAVEAFDLKSLHAALAEGPVDILVSDYDLQWINGFEVYASVKEAHPNCVAVMFTGTGNEELAVRAMKAGFDDYVVKSPGQLKRVASSAKLAYERSAERRHLRDNRELLRKELYHRLHNNLQIVVSLMGLTARAIKEPSARELVRDLMRRVQSLSLLQERFYRDEDLRHIDIGSFISELVADVESFSATMKVTSDVHPLKVQVDVAVPLALITNELLMEADHRYTSGVPAVLSVSLNRVGERIVLTITSDGASLSEVSQGHFGIELVRRLAGQIDAEVEHKASGRRTTTRVLVSA
jgi:two-component sensor histidine kinase